MCRLYASAYSGLLHMYTKITLKCKKNANGTYHDILKAETFGLYSQQPTNFRDHQILLQVEYIGGTNLICNIKTYNILHLKDQFCIHIDTNILIGITHNSKPLDMRKRERGNH